MKILIIVLLLISARGYSIDDYIDFSFDIEFGLIPKGHIKQYEYSVDLYKNMSFYGNTYFELQFLDNILFSGIGTKLYIWKVNGGYGFHADYINMMFTLGLRYKLVEIGFRHYCEHPIISWIDGNYIDSNWERMYEELYIKIHYQSE